MKKTLIALAALAATSAFAQSSVTMYGRLDAGYAHSKTTIDTNVAGIATRTEANTNGVNSHNSVSSFWGIKGSEDLGGGMKAEFKLEGDVFPATGNTGFSGAAGGNASNGAFNRVSLLGASGGFGSIMFGRDYTPTFSLIGASDLFGLTRLSTVGLAAGVPAATMGSTVGRQIIYTTPNFGGFTGKFSMGRDDRGTNALNGDNSNKDWHLTGIYAQGPLMVGLGFGRNEATTPTVVSATTLVGTVLTTTNTTTGVSNSKAETVALTASYDFGVAKLVAGYVNAKSRIDTAFTAESNAKEFNLGVSVPMGAVTLLGQIGRNSLNGTNNLGATVTDQSGTDWVLGADYALSKRTALFVKTGVVNKMAGTLNGVATDSKLTETNFGVKHTF